MKQKSGFEAIKHCLPVAIMGVVIFGLVAVELMENSGKRKAGHDKVAKFTAQYPNWADSIAEFDAKNKNNIVNWRSAAKNADTQKEADSLYALLGRCDAARTDMMDKKLAVQNRVKQYRDSIYNVHGISK